MNRKHGLSFFSLVTICGAAALALATNAVALEEAVTTEPLGAEATLQAAPKDVTSLEKEQLYYEVDRARFSTRPVELRGAMSYDVSNPYSHVYGGNFEAYWRATPALSYGVSTGFFRGEKKSAFARFEEDARRNGNAIQTSTPTFAGRGVVRVTPIHGLLNFLSTSVMEADVSAVFRAGVVNYQEYGSGPTVGTGLEFTLGFTKSVGLHTGAYWDFDRPKAMPWGNRVSLMVGPTIRL